MTTTLPVPHDSAPTLSEQDLRVLTEAARCLEHPGFVGQVAYVVGVPLERVIGVVSPRWSSVLTRLIHIALAKAYDHALVTLRDGKTTTPSNRAHRWLAGVSGSLGGAFGIASLAAELPVSATLMLRSIADIARSHGEDLSDPGTKLACLEVFAMGGKQPLSQGADTSYYALRSILAKTVSEAGKQVAASGLAAQGSPALVRLLQAVSARFSLPLSQKLALQALPVIGAVGGASVNLLFMRHFQQLAEAHFSVRQLERRYGREPVQQAYGLIAAELDSD